MLATKSSRSPGVLPGWRVGAADAVVGLSDTPGTLLFLSRTVAGVGAAVLLSCVRGVTSELGNVCMTLLSRNRLFPSREKLRESRSPYLGSHRPLRGVIPVRLPRSWLSRDRLFPLRGRTRGVRWARLQRKRLRLRRRPCKGSRVCLSRERLCLLSLSILPPRDLRRRMCRPRRFSPWSGLELCKGIHDSDRLVAGERSLWLRSALLASRRMFRVDTMIPEHFVGGRVRRVAAKYNGG